MVSATASIVFDVSKSLPSRAALSRKSASVCGVTVIVIFRPRTGAGLNQRTVCVPETLYRYDNKQEGPSNFLNSAKDLPPTTERSPVTLEEEIAEAQSCYDNPPKNESNTCDWITLPLLRANGYTRWDIESRVVDNTGQFPDYTLLSNDSSATWYLEAKAWNISLLDIHAKQALNYANHNGKRFVVLANGQVWRLYDNAIQGVIGDKLVAHATLRDTEQITNFLTALSKSEVLSGSLPRLAAEFGERKAREDIESQERQKQNEEAVRFRERQSELLRLLHTTLPEQLRDPTSDIVGLITRYLNEQEELNDLTPETLTLWFDELFAQPLDKGQVVAVVPAPTPNTASIPPSTGTTTQTLQALQNLAIDGNASRPTTLLIPDGTQIAVRTWVELAVEVVRFLLQQPTSPPIPFVSSHRTRRFLSHTPEHNNPELRKKFKPVTANGKTVYLDADRSGDMFLHDLYNLCLAMQIAPKGFRITIVTKQREGATR